MLHYTSCGLRNAWIANGYHVRRTAYGKAVAIEDVDGLHQVIAKRLIATKPRLSGAELRFLRLELGMSQAVLASILGNDAQTISLWERAGRVPKWADRFVRALYREKAEGNAQIIALVDRLKKLNGSGGKRMVFAKTKRGWGQLAA